MIINADGWVVAYTGDDARFEYLYKFVRAGSYDPKYRATDLVGAPPMDRPKDVEPNPKNGKVYVMPINNFKRKPEQVDAGNPRAKNSFGHIVETAPEGGNHASTISHWEILIKAGDPSIADVGAMYHPDTSENGWFAAPDNRAIDGQGRLWVSTD